MKYCKKCGQNIESNVDICPKCGEKLEDTVQENNGLYNIRNPFLELRSTTPSNDNQGNNTLTYQGFSMSNNTNNVAQSKTLNAFTNTNVMGPSNQVQEQQNNSIGSGNINVAMADITDKNLSSVSIEDNKKEDNNISNDNFLAFPNNNQKVKTNEQEAKENLERLKKLNNPVLDFDPQKIKEAKEKSEKEAKLKKEKENKSPKYMSYIYIILAAIMLFLTIIPLIYDLQVITLIHHLVIVVLLVVSYKLSPINKKITSLIGLATSIAMILTILEKDYVTLALGVALLLAEGFSYFAKDKKLKS